MEQPEKIIKVHEREIEGIFMKFWYNFWRKTNETSERYGCKQNYMNRLNIAF